MKQYLILTMFFTFILFQSTIVKATDDIRMQDARSMSMGNDCVTQSVITNPSLVALQLKRSLALSYSNKYGMKELNTAGLSFSYPNEWLSCGLNISSFGFSGYRESTGRLFIGKKLFGFLSAGVSVQYYLLQSQLYENNLQRISTDIALSFIPVQNLLISVLINDIPSYTFGDDTIENKDFDSYYYRIGFQWTVMNTLLITSTCHVDELKKIGCTVGMEYHLSDLFAFRAGLQSHPFIPSLGIGADVSHFSFNVAAHKHPQLGITSAISIHFSF